MNEKDDMFFELYDKLIEKINESKDLLTKEECISLINETKDKVLFGEELSEPTLNIEDIFYEEKIE